MALESTTTRGIVTNIERFAIHDGPGIRTVIFMKGCPLTCLWCSSPETQNMFPEMEYLDDRCMRCAKCAEVCPSKAVVLSSVKEVLTARQFCDNCGKCAEVCPMSARIMVGKEMTVGEVLDIIEKDTVFYQNSCGGITLSGGEPTKQPKFSLEIVRACQSRGIHTAMETCGYVEWDILSEMLRYIDLVYVDVKHMSTAEHQKLTGKRNELILENIEKISAKYDTPLVIRIPIVPGYNDSAENIARTATFSRRLKRVERIELLPYHKLGISTYKFLFRDYPLLNLEVPDNDCLRDLERIIRSFDVQVQIGG